MLMIIVTIVGTGTVTNTYTLDKYSPIIDEFNRVCEAHTYKGYEHARVTLWDTDTNMTHGSREVNKPEKVIPTTEEIRKWIRSNCAEEMKADKKIAAIKSTRTQFGPDRGFVQLGLKEAKEHVEAVMSESKPKLPPCGSPLCNNMDCEF